MGARVYIPALGRFLSVDPVQDGSYNNYTYAVDPVNEFDLTGNALPWKKIANIASAASMIPGPIGMVASGVAAASYAAAGDKKAAALAIACVAAAAIPGGVAAIKVATAAKVAKNATTTRKLGALAIAAAKPVHGNSLASMRPTVGYHLINNTTKQIMKVGITSAKNPVNRYTAKYYRENGVHMVPVKNFSNRDLQDTP